LNHTIVESLEIKGEFLQIVGGAGLVPEGYHPDDACALSELTIELGAACLYALTANRKGVAVAEAEANGATHEERLGIGVAATSASWTEVAARIAAMVELLASLNAGDEFKARLFDPILKRWKDTGYQECEGAGSQVGAIVELLAGSVCELLRARHSERGYQKVDATKESYVKKRLGDYIQGKMVKVKDGHKPRLVQQSVSGLHIFLFVKQRGRVYAGSPTGMLELAQAQGAAASGATAGQMAGAAAAGAIAESAAAAVAAAANAAATANAAAADAAAAEAQAEVEAEVEAEDEEEFVEVQMSSIKTTLERTALWKAKASAARDQYLTDEQQVKNTLDSLLLAVEQPEKKAEKEVVAKAKQAAAAAKAKAKQAAKQAAAAAKQAAKDNADTHSVVSMMVAEVADAAEANREVAESLSGYSALLDTAATLDIAATARGFSSDREKKVKLAKEAREEWTDPTTGRLKYPNTQRTVKNHRRNIALSDLALTTTQHTPNGSKMKGPARRNMMTMKYNSMSDEQQETRWGDQAERRYVDLEAQIANYRLADASEKNPKKRKKNAKGAGRDPETRKARDRRARQQ
jgi:hypothetical protein